MEWSNIRMSKAEFERLQKEYAEAAIRTAEKAKLSYDADEPKEEIPKTENIAVAISRLPTQTVENVNETIKPDSAKNTTVQMKITEVESEITASDTEDENKKSEEAETNIPVNEEKSDENSDTADTDDKQQNSSVGSTDDEESTAEIYGDKSDNTADSEIPDKTENHTVDEILRSFESTFMSEEEADKKIEDFSKSVSDSCPAPDFNAKIHNHNNNQDKSGKTCGCERCRCQNGGRMQEKGGQKPN
jgi:hypothetical protein